MRVRSFQSESQSSRLGEQLNKVFLSHSDDKYDHKKDDGDFDKIYSHLYGKIKESPKAMYQSIKKWDAVGMTNQIIDKCMDMSNWKPLLPLFAGFCAVFFFIWLLASITSSSSTLTFNKLKSAKDGTTSQVDDKLFYALEIDEIVTKLIDVRKTGKMMEFEATLSHIIPKYCLNTIKVPLSTKAEESFHLNVAEMISFIANNGEFTKHQTLKLAPNGGIVDPNLGDEKHGFKTEEFQSCPLLDEIFRVASLKDRSTITANNPNIPDNIDQFDKSYNFDNVEYFVDYTIKLMQGECDQLRDRLEIEDQKNLVLNFFNTIKQRSGNPDVDVASHYQIYVIASDGSIYESEIDYDKEVYYRCVPIEVVLNTNVIIEPEMTITNLKIALDKEYE